MARRPNPRQSVVITVSTTPQNLLYLKELVEDGGFGKNIADVAEKLISDRLLSLRSKGAVAERLKQVELRQRSDNQGADRA